MAPIRSFSPIECAARRDNAVLERDQRLLQPALPSLNRHRPLRLTAQSAAISCIGASRTPDGSAPGMPRHAGVRQTFTVVAANG
jgi:hypothetical protein